MDEIIPWEEWISLVVPHYPTGKRGRPPIEIETMLRMYLLQCWFSLSDEGVEDAIYDSYAMRKFMGLNFFEQDVPDATNGMRAFAVAAEQPEKANPLKHIEDTVEQNDNNFDGMLECAPTLPSTTKGQATPTLTSCPPSGP